MKNAKKLNANMVKVITLMSDGEYHSGVEIGDRLNLTRSAVWKIFKKLDHYQIQIQASKGKGYLLLEPLILLDKASILHEVYRLSKEKINLSLFESMPSTNDYLIHKKSNNVLFCLAEQQTQGRGRLNRRWFSPFGKNLYLSCRYPFQKDISELAGLSLVVSLALIKALKKFGVTHGLSVKWPNDIVYEHKKVSGILIDIQAETHGLSHAIIGTGMNVNMLAEESSIGQPWTSIQKILHQYVNRNTLCAYVIHFLLHYLRQFNQKGFSPFIEEWTKNDCLMHQRLMIKNINEKIQGIMIGINQQGHLLLRLQNGTIRAFSSGDTTIVK